MIQNFNVGDEVVIDSDNENYEEYMGMVLTVASVATSRDEHRGFDETAGCALYDLQTEDGTNIPFSLYDYELDFA